MSWKDLDTWGANEADTIDKTALEQRAMKRVVKNDHIHFQKAKALSDLCTLPKPNEQWRIITEKQFNAYAAILYLLQEDGEIQDFHLAIYRINQPTVESLIRLIEERKIKKATFIISNFFKQTKRAEIWARKLREFCIQNEHCEHKYTHMHAKVLTGQN